MTNFVLPSKIPSHAHLVFDGVVFQVFQWDQELFDGSTAVFEAAKRANAVSIIPIIDDKLVVLHEEQPSHPPRTGFVGGHVDPGEDPLTAAIRELHEETGMTFGSLKLVQVEDIGGSRVDWWDYHFIATDLLRQEKPHQEAGERITLEMTDFATAQKYALDNIYMSNGIMERVDSIEELLALPETVQEDISLK